MELAIIICQIVIIVLLAVVLVRLFLPRGKEEMEELRRNLISDSAESQNRILNGLNTSMQSFRNENDVKFNNMEQHLERTINGRLNAEAVRSASADQQQIQAIHELKTDLLRQNDETQEKILQKLVDSIQTMNSVNNERLSRIQADINQKLDQSLNERLDSSFEKIGNQLSSLYKTIGELQTLATGVDSLNRTLSNVKTRGTWGEMQLEQILANVFPPSLYDKNVQMKAGSQERVEFAIRIPDKSEEGGFLYLPIDSKFPADTYNRIQAAAQNMDMKAMEGAVRDLEIRIKSEAKDIASKYINPPHTTDFAVLFLPSEGLYAEVLRIPGLAEYCQKELKVILSGPTTISALLNSLAVGFRFLTVSKNTQDVLKVLSNVKAQYAKFGEMIEKTQKNLDTAVRTTEDMKKRTDQIQRRLEKVSTLGLEDQKEEWQNDLLDHAALLPSERENL